MFFPWRRRKKGGIYIDYSRYFLFIPFDTGYNYLKVILDEKIRLSMVHDIGKYQ